MDKTQIRQVLIDQQSELFDAQSSAKPRQQVSELTQLIEQSSLIKVVLGIRRCGKSTLCHQALLGRQTIYVNFDDERWLSLTANDLHKVLEIAKEINPTSKHYFFDEIQNIQGWEPFVSRLHRTNHNLVLSGSNGKLLGKDLATHLTGRQLSIFLQPLSFAEIVRWKGLEADYANLTTTQRTEISKLFAAYFESGGFPEVVLGEPQGYYLRELFDKIITRDIVQRYKIRDIKVLKEIGAYLIQNTAQMISYDNIKKTFGLQSIVTTRKYVQLLQDVFLIHEMKGYSYKLKERSTSRRKTYACDLGMVKALWTKPTPDLGARLETLIYLHLLNTKQEIYYLNEDSREVDFCLIHGTKPHQLLQVCYDLSNAKTKDREIRALHQLGTKYKVKELCIITRDVEEELNYKGHTIRILPAYKYLLE